MTQALDIDVLAKLPPAKIAATLRAAVEHRKFNKLDFFVPSRKQFEFIAMGKEKRRRVLSAGNQQGKSTIGAYEDAVHATGLYPKDWPGHRFGRPTNGWVCGVSSQTVRDIGQTLLCGPPGVEAELGTGFIPRHCFVDKPTLMRHGVADAIEMVRVWWHDEHGVRAGISTIGYKAYVQGRAAFQGPTKDWLHRDEEPPEDVYTEGEARYSAVPDGRSWMTFTPEEGFTSVVNRYWEGDDPTCGLLIMTADDAVEAGLWTPEMLADAKRKYQKHEWPSRLYGNPRQGIGRIFTTDEEKIVFPADQVIPPHWKLLWGIDFGFDHPFAALLAAIDIEADVVYLIAEHRAVETFPIMHAEAIRRIAAEAPVAWPHDGGVRDGMGSGEPVAMVYKRLGLKMLHESARWPDGSNSTEAAVLEEQQRFADGRLRVREDLSGLREEYRGYHRKLDKSGNSIIVKKRDDLIACLHKIVMMKRHARSVKMGWTARPVRPGLADRPRQAPLRNPWTGQEIGSAPSGHGLRQPQDAPPFGWRY